MMSLISSLSYTNTCMIMTLYLSLMSFQRSGMKYRVIKI